MEYRVTFYETEDGQKPVLDLLTGLEQTNPVLHKLITAGIRKLKHRENHGEPLTQSISGSVGMLELRVGRTDIARVFFFFRAEREIVCTNGYVKKSRKLDPSQLAKAERYKEDWERRHP